MKKLIAILLAQISAILIFGSAITFAQSPAPTANTTSSTPCTNSVSFLGIPTWYEYLTVTERADGNGCGIDNSNVDPKKVILLIALAIVDILTRVAAIAAVVFVVYGGVLFVLSQGEPGKIVSARKTIVNALVGLVIALLASQIVRFFASVITK